MSINKDWYEKIIPISKLSLDLGNPRIPEYEILIAGGTN